MLDFQKQAEDETATDDTPVPVIMRKRNRTPYLASNGKPFTLLVVGEYSKQYRANDRKLMERVRKEIRAGRDYQNEERFAAEKIACGVIGWENAEVGGQPAAFSTDGVVEFLLVAPWDAQDVLIAIKEHSGFFEMPSPA